MRLSREVHRHLLAKACSWRSTAFSRRNRRSSCSGDSPGTPESIPAPRRFAHARSWSGRMSSSRPTCARLTPWARRSATSRTASALNSALNSRRSRRPDPTVLFPFMNHLRPETRASKASTKSGQLQVQTSAFTTTGATSSRIVTAPTSWVRRRILVFTNPLWLRESGSVPRSENQCGAVLPSIRSVQTTHIVRSQMQRWLSIPAQAGSLAASPGRGTPGLRTSRVRWKSIPRLRALEFVILSS